MSRISFLLAVVDILMFLLQFIEYARLLLESHATLHRVRQILVVVRQINVKQLAHPRKEFLLRKFSAASVLHLATLIPSVHHTDEVYLCSLLRKM